MNYNLLKKPLITEKTTLLAGKNTYAFIVDKQASKTEIRELIEKLYSVKVLRVTTVNYRPGKQYLWRYRKTSFKPAFKKAYIQLSAGQTIDLFVAPEEEKKAKRSKRVKK